MLSRVTDKTFEQEELSDSLQASEPIGRELGVESDLNDIKTQGISPKRSPQAEEVGEKRNSQTEEK